VPPRADERARNQGGTSFDDPLTRTERGSLSLAPFAVGDDRDLIKVSYSGAPLLPDYITTGNGGDPFTETGWTGWLDLNAAADVSNRNGGFVTLGPCFQTGVLTLDVGGTGHSANDACNTQTDTATIATGRISAGEAVTVSSNENRAFTDRRRSCHRSTRGVTRWAHSSTSPSSWASPAAVSTFTSPLTDVVAAHHAHGLPEMHRRPCSFGGRRLLGPGSRAHLQRDPRTRRPDGLIGRADKTGHRSWSDRSAARRR